MLKACAEALYSCISCFVTAIEENVKKRLNRLTLRSSKWQCVSPSATWDVHLGSVLPCLWSYCSYEQSRMAIFFRGNYPEKSRVTLFKAVRDFRHSLSLCRPSVVTFLHLLTAKKNKTLQSVYSLNVRARVFRAFRCLKTVLRVCISIFVIFSHLWTW